MVSDALGGFAAMLVALPSAVAFGIMIMSPLGTEFGTQGAMAGILGAIALGIIAPLFSGAPRLITTPCAPAAAVLAAFVLHVTEMSRKAGGTPIEPGQILLLITLLALISGGFQVLFGLLGGGRLIKYIPYPVVAGYLSGVGALIFIGQLPKFLGVPSQTAFWTAILHPSLWNQLSILIGLVTAAIMIVSGKFTRAIPAPIIAMAGGVLTYFGLSVFYPELTTLQGNPLVIGSIQSDSNIGFFQAFVNRWSNVTSLSSEHLTLIFTPALTLAVLLSIDTLKTCVVVDALTRSRHNSNRELIGQGVGNMASALIGGISGAGAMGATLVNISSGGKTRLSGVFEGIFSALALLLLGKFIAWIPIASLAGILIVVAFRMVDRQSFRLLRQRSTILDFVVIAAVVLTAITFNLIGAAGVGLALAIMLFIREQIRGSVVRRKAFGGQLLSKKRRLPTELAILEKMGSQAVILELQGSLFFGTADQLYTEVEPYLSRCKYILLDMRRIQSIDFSATHTLEILEASVAERGGSLIFAHLPRNLPTRQDIQTYFSQVGLVRAERHVRIHPHLDAALEEIEEEILAAAAASRVRDESPLNLEEVEIFADAPQDVLRAMRECITERSFPRGETIFRQGDCGDELFIIRRGDVKIVLPLQAGASRHLATFGRGDFFGDMSFLDQGKRSADALAATDTDLYIISRSKFEEIARKEPRTAGVFFSRIARVLAIRLRHTDMELSVIEGA